MKLGKYIAAAMLAAAILGATNPAFATTASESPDQKESTVGVDIIDAPIGQEAFTLKKVPAAFNFQSFSRADGYYSLEAEELDAEFRAFKNFTPRLPLVKGEENEPVNYRNVYTVSAKVSPLTVSRNEASVGTIDVTDFVINSHSIGSSTGVANFLYGDTDFATKVEGTSDYTIPVTRAMIEFSKEDLQMDDELSGTVTYSVDQIISPD